LRQETAAATRNATATTASPAHFESSHARPGALVNFSVQRFSDVKASTADDQAL
jgi:hypothetical protein